ncbi:phosphoglucomutase/phosphomannomutase family protein [Hydrogenothermus marinus]|uniref:Phosphomannomutase n=1 Tax=Hydrogenothermus marinus TaxID=133270 RepID=A0A3M0B7J3_9AQUI|nr:phosphoglucomutase/phosphomannomutase family protein [Hydrogenothermus marinus]RMA93067.1 phosphomannomutase [Hydrogenothermus marinus]
MSIKFGTDGWRAIIAKDFTFENLSKVAQAHADYLKEEGKNKIAIGYDPRFMSEDFAELVAEVFASNDFKVILSDRFCSTPALSLAVKELGLDEGVMITASHNTYQYNGYKVKGGYGGPATASMIEKIESKLKTAKPKFGKKEWEKKDFNKLYLNKLSSYFDKEEWMQKNIKVVHDPMHGATIGYLSKVLGDSAVEVEEINNYRDAFFGFKHPEPIDKNLGLLKGKVVAEEAQLGIANDGDGDRVGIVDEAGEFVSTQIVYVLLLLHTIRNKKIDGAIAKTVSTTYLVDRIAKKEGRQVFKTPVGFKYIADLFLKEKIAFGGEESGGYGFGFHIPERDGLLSGLMMLDMMILSNKTVLELVEDLFKEFGPAYYERVDLKVEGDEGRNLVKKLRKEPIKKLGKYEVADIDLTDGIKFILEDDSWLLLRASGTEPVLRIYAEAPDKEKVKYLIEEAKKLIGG